MGLGKLSILGMSIKHPGVDDKECFLGRMYESSWLNQSITEYFNLTAVC